MSGIMNKVKNALHSDNSHSTTHTTSTTADPNYQHNTGIGGTTHNTTGQSSHQSHIPGVGHSSHQSHNSAAVHEDRTGRNLLSGEGIVDGTSSHQSHTGLNSSTHPQTTAGVHQSNMMNKLDPTVDSDLSGGNHLGAQSDTRTAGYSGAGTTGAGLGHSSNVGHQSHVGSSGLSGQSTGYGSSTTHTTAGPHSSNLMNKADPRVDSDRSNTHAHNMTTTGSGPLTSSANTGTHGGISNSTNAGPHNSNLANRADPRVDSDLSGAGGRVGHAQHGITGASGSHATPGSGTAQNTAGPHNSDMMNKLDPRVDSDLSGGKTYGGNKTNA